MEQKKWKVSLTSMSKDKLHNVVNDMVHEAKVNGVKISVIHLPKKQKLFSVQKSPFIYGATKDQFFYEKRTIVLFIQFQTGQSIDLFGKIQIPAGVSVAPKPLT